MVSILKKIEEGWGSKKTYAVYLNRIDGLSDSKRRHTRAMIERGTYHSALAAVGGALQPLGGLADGEPLRPPHRREPFCIHQKRLSGKLGSLLFKG